MEKPIIAKKGPFLMDMQPGNYFYCSCGKSSKQPFCDGSHQGSEFTPIKVEVTDIKKIAWCGCKHSANLPFCDGSHTKL
jgi:CDGSH iron-sulfur domain-containing protein 3